ncbi:MAG: hypothetical protein WCB46_08840, partial [Methanoregula sp.]
ARTPARNPEQPAEKIIFYSREKLIFARGNIFDGFLYFQKIPSLRHIAVTYDAQSKNRYRFFSS